METPAIDRYLETITLERVKAVYRLMNTVTISLKKVVTLQKFIFDFSIKKKKHAERKALQHYKKTLHYKGIKETLQCVKRWSSVS